MATGPENGIYDEIGKLYRKIFADNGVTLKLRQTNGSADNIKLLDDPHSGVSVALVMGGMTDTNRSPALESLGTVFYEPYWLFSRTAQEGRAKAIRKGMRVSMGMPGSGTYEIGREMITAVGIDTTAVDIRDLGPVEAGEALMRGELDFVGMSLPWVTPIVQRLLRDPNIITYDWLRADAHVALRPYLNKRILPRGVADLANDRPPRDITLIATRTSLIVRDDLHPALQQLLLEAASEIHGGPGVFNKSGEFPAAEPIDLPLSEYAREYYRNGTSFLQRYLPFWLAALTSRLLVLLIPLVGVAYPLFRLLPALYGWSMRRRILRLYGELKFLEAELETGTPADAAEVSEQLDRLEQRANRMRVPVTFNQMLYTLKQHIGLVRGRLSHPRPPPE